MAATANIITATKNDVLMVPSASVQTQNGTSTVRVLKNGKVQEVNVEIGLSSSSQVEITSGLSEGDTVITSITTSTSTNQSRGQTSVFGGGGGGGIMRIGR
jgi:macrolide-specific efflux system membrane fusion protein